MSDDLRPARPQFLQPTTALADHLAAQRERLLQAWQTAVSADPELVSSEELSRTEFRDHIPEVLTEFEAFLRRGNGDPAAPKPDAANGTAEHGAHRWKQGYDLREVILEWGHLHRCLLREVESARAVLPDLTPDVFVGAVHSVADLINNAIAGSAEQYALLQQKETIQERADLERTVARFTEDSERRTRLWSESAHDLRGQLTIVTSATALMEEPDVEEALRVESLAMLGQGTRSLREMLAGLLENAQSQAVREERRLGAFNAGTLLGGLCAASQPLARESGLTLRFKGSENLPVEGDRGKVLRIAQNLMLNALQYTKEGGVTLSWQVDSADAWSFQVRDTGPGLPGENTGLFRSGERRHREGIGLSIVRRLSALLGATVDIETAAGAGTAFTVRLPRRYAV